MVNVETASVPCPHCGQAFRNDLDLDEHFAMVHDEKWTGDISQSENGDLNATGAVSPLTEDTLATDGGIDRPPARERAASAQGRR